jgi:glycosyltransferase involved in cell wall biosynthesis
VSADGEGARDEAVTGGAAREETVTGVADPRPVLFVTNHAPAFRTGAFAALHEAEGVVFALVGGGVRHGGAIATENLPFPVIRRSQRGVGRLAASGRFRAVIAGLSGRVALPAAYFGARGARVPFVLWATIWRHPRTAAHALSYFPLRHIYRHADAIATYGPHVSAYVRSKGATAPVVEAPQSVDDAFWSAPASPTRHAPFQVMFAGRLVGEKGLPVLLRAWRASGLQAPEVALIMVGDGPFRARAVATGATVPEGPLGPEQVRSYYAGSDVVVVPSVATRDFLEPWGLVVNEAFDQGVPVIATTAVGAAAGGLVRDGETGLVVPAGDHDALAAALRRLHGDPQLRARLGAAGRAAVASGHSHAHWAAGMRRALAAVGADRGC